MQHSKLSKDISAAHREVRALFALPNNMKRSYRDKVRHGASIKVMCTQEQYNNLGNVIKAIPTYKLHSIMQKYQLQIAIYNRRNIFGVRDVSSHYIRFMYKRQTIKIPKLSKLTNNL